jgi:hypothetical protein
MAERLLKVTILLLKVMAEMPEMPKMALSLLRVMEG